MDQAMTTLVPGQDGVSWHSGVYMPGVSQSSPAHPQARGHLDSWQLHGTHLGQSSGQKGFTTSGELMVPGEPGIKIIS